MIRKKTISECLYVLLFLIAVGDTYIVRVIFNWISALPLIPFTGQQLMYGIFAVCYILKFPEMIQRLVRKRAYDVYAVIILFTVSSVVFYFNGWESRISSDVDSIQRLLLFSVPVYIMARSIDVYDELMNHFWLIGAVLFIFYIKISPMGVSQNMQQGYDTHMTLGYNIGFVSVMALDYFFHGTQSKFFRWICLAVAIYGCFYVIMYGSRGTFLCLFAYFLMIGIEKIKSGSTRKRAAVIFFCSALFLLLTIFSDELAVALQLKLSHTSVDSRTLAWLLQSDSGLGMSGRDRIYDSALELIRKDPFGYGVLADREFFGSYVHNLFLEIMLDFGWIVGGSFCLILIVRFIKLLRNPWMKRVRWIVIFSLGQLMVSSSYIQSGWFWIALGFLMSSGYNYGEEEEFIEGVETDI